MHDCACNVHDMPDGELLAAVNVLRAREREAAGALIAALAEVDRRGLYLSEGYSSLYLYCVNRLGFSEFEAYNRMLVARLIPAYPTVLDRLTDGRVTLTAITLVARHLTEDNQHELLDAVSHKTKREVMELLAERYPQPDV